MSLSFWNFSIDVYRAPAVQEECLAVQEQFGLDVNLVLLCAYLGAERSIDLTADDVAAAQRLVGQWHEDVVRTLRAARRNLKTIDPGQDVADAASELRTKVKAAELEAERIEQAMLESWADARLAGRPRAEPGDAVRANLQTLLAACGIGPERLTVAKAMRHIIAAALAVGNGRND